MWYYLILLWLFISHCSWVHRRGAEYSSFFTVMLWYLCCYQCCKLYTCLKCNRDVPLVFLNTSLKVKIRTLWELQWPRWLAHSLLSLFPAKRARWEKKKKEKKQESTNIRCERKQAALCSLQHCPATARSGWPEALCMVEPGLMARRCRPQAPGFQSEVLPLLVPMPACLPGTVPRTVPVRKICLP